MDAHKRSHTSIFVVKMEVLLGLAQKWGGADRGWEQWRTHVVEVLPGGKSDSWVDSPVGDSTLARQSFERVNSERPKVQR